MWSLRKHCRELRFALPSGRQELRFLGIVSSGNNIFLKELVCNKILMQPKQALAINWKAVGRRIRELRGFDMNQAAMARRVGISQGALSKYEKGKAEIGAAVLLRISREFKKSIEWLLTGEE